MSTELQKVSCLAAKVEKMEKKLKDTDKLVRTMSAALNATQMALLYISDRMPVTDLDCQSIDWQKEKE